MSSAIRRGIILAGGFGTRLYPTTRAVNKQLLLVHDKPLIYYALGTLLEIGVREILIITMAEQVALFERLLGRGDRLGVSISFATQETPRGIASALAAGRQFVTDSTFALILGDNIFCSTNGIRQAAAAFETGATIFSVTVPNPVEFGVAAFDQADGRLVDIVEKPQQAPSDQAIVGLYLYDDRVFDIVDRLSPSSRGEYEISDVNRVYLKENKLSLVRLGNDIVWFDAGAPDSMLRASDYFRSSGAARTPGYIEAIARDSGCISRSQFAELLDLMPDGSYKTALSRI